MSSSPLFFLVGSLTITETRGDVRGKPEFSSEERREDRFLHMQWRTAVPSFPLPHRLWWANYVLLLLQWYPNTVTRFMQRTLGKPISARNADGRVASMSDTSSPVAW